MFSNSSLSRSSFSRLSPAFSHRRRWLVFVGTLLLVGAVAFTTGGLLAATPSHSPVAPGLPETGLSTSLRSSAAPTAGSRQPRGPDQQTQDGELAPIPPTVDPERFVIDVARSLFDWDTTGPYVLADLKGRLLAVADPSGAEAPGLVADLDGFLPTPDAWTLLSEYDTRQWLEIERVHSPAQWDRAVAAASNDEIAPGTTALTVTGVRHRAGVWEGEPVAESFDVSFTAFVLCEPTYPRCYLLRLSRLDEPLR